MKIFVCNRTIDLEATDAVLDELLSVARDSIAVMRESEHSENWKERIEKQFKEVDFVVVFIGKNSHCNALKILDTQLDCQNCTSR